MVDDLLYQRSRTLKTYTEWKYRSDNDKQFRGVVALIDNKPIGCFGSIPKKLILSDGNIVNCGWFADWYVSPKARGIKVGELLLNALTDYEPIMFGHPGPKAAQKICLSNDYCKIGFHSRRRFILRRWSYNWKRKNLLMGIKNRLSPSTKQKESLGQVVSMVGGKDAEKNYNQHPNAESTIHFNTSVTYEEWIKQQPISEKCTREFGEWEQADVCVKYFDEKLRNGETRRSVLTIDGENNLDLNLWRSFIASTRRMNQDYIEVFITNKNIDTLFQQLGAWHIYEPPILVKGLNQTENIKIEALDRENWTYLADLTQ